MVLHQRKNYLQEGEAPKFATQKFQLSQKLTSSCLQQDLYTTYKKQIQHMKLFPAVDVK